MFPLARPHESNFFHAISIYLDEAGQLKNLPSNMRATGIASMCGFKDVPFAGDVYIGRLNVEGGKLKNVDFRLEEMKSDAAWLTGVEQQNYEYGVATNQISMDSGGGGNSVGEMGGVNVEKGYSWSETQDSVDINVKTPEEIKSSKQILVKFHSKKCVISSKVSDWIVQLDLYQNVSTDDCTWTFNINESMLEISMEKSNGIIWGQLES